MVIIKKNKNNASCKYMHKNYLYLVREYAFNSKIGCSTRTAQSEAVNYQQLNVSRRIKRYSEKCFSEITLSLKILDIQRQKRCKNSKCN